MRRGSLWVPIVAVLPLAAIVPATAARHPWVEGESLEFRLPDPEGRVVGSTDERFEEVFSAIRAVRGLPIEIETLLGEAPR